MRIRIANYDSQLRITLPKSVAASQKVYVHLYYKCVCENACVWICVYVYGYGYVCAGIYIYPNICSCKVNERDVVYSQVKLANPHPTCNK